MSASESPAARRTGAGRRAARRGASDQVALEIQHHIQRQRLRPGDFLGREGDLAEEFEVSRPTLREALKVLTTGNLVQASKGPGGGIFVAGTADEGISRSLSDAIAVMLDTGSVSLEELLDARLMLEVPIAGLAASRADFAAIAALREAVEAHAGADGERRATDARVHRAIAEAAQNRMVIALTDWVLEVLQPSLHELIGPALVHDAVVDQHRALLAAIARGDPNRAERAMKDHLLYLRDVLQMVRERDGGAGG